MKKISVILGLILVFFTSTFAQNKITPDLLEMMEQGKGTNDKFQVIIIMNDQLDAQKVSRNTQYLDKKQQREVVVNELQRLSSHGQIELMKDLDQGQKASLVEDVKTFWIINAVSCSATADVVRAIAERPDVMYVMKDLEIHAIDGEDANTIQSRTSSNHWNIEKVNADKVWAMGYTGAGVLVAVIDSGVNYNHVDIVNNMWNGGSEYPHHGWDFVNNDNDPMDDGGHGTHCAGTVASVGASDTQYGISKDTKIMALKTLSAGGSGYKSDSWTAIEFAVSHGADILSMSYGGAGKGGYFSERVVMEHVLRCGVVASVAAGNEGNNLDSIPVPYNVSAPGNCPPPWHNPDQTLEGGRSAVVTVGSITSSDAHSSSSSIGPVTWAEGDYVVLFHDYPWESGSDTITGLIKPDLSAPGVNITSLAHNSNTGYTTKSGTSMATPCVAGVMALMLSVNPTLTPIEIDSILETTAVPLGGQTAKNNTFGAGRIDALAAVNYMLNACAAPSGLEATIRLANVNLSWTAATNVSSYRIYRNGAMIANDVLGTTFTDENAPAGNNTYFVRSNGNNHQASVPSNQVTVNMTTNALANAPKNLEVASIDMSNNSVALTWEAPETRQSLLYYSNTGSYYASGASLATTDNKFVAAQKYPSSMLQPYAGMEITDVVFTVRNANVTCTVNLYEGDALLTGTEVYSGNVTTTEEKQTVTKTLETPVAINPSKDLWLTITLNDKLLYNHEYDCSEGNNALIFRDFYDSYWVSNAGLSWAFQIGLSDGAYTYNVYCNDIAVSTAQNATSFNGTYSESINTYHVTATTNGFESPYSNMVHMVRNNATLTDLDLDADEQLIVSPGGILTVTGTLKSTDPDHLVLEDGAQLFSNSTNVKATVKKHIRGFVNTNNKHGWYLIASPLTQALDIADNTNLLAENDVDYDLYIFDQASDGNEWQNYKQSHFSTADPKTGYLYANKNDIDIALAGTLQNSTSDTSKTVALTYVADKTFSGYNLVGNPYPCNATITRDYFRIVDTEEGSKLQLASSAIAPMEGVIVKSIGTADSTLTFTKATVSKGGHHDSNITLSVARDQGGVLDIARIRPEGELTMEKLSLGDGGTCLYITQNDKDYALAVSHNDKVIPVRFKAAKDGNYSIGVTVENLRLNYLHLIDRLTGADVDLLQTPSYSFKAKTDDDAARFRIVFNANTIPNPFEDDADLSEGNIQIIDVTGRVVTSYNGRDLYIPSDGIAPGIYILKNTTNNKTKKIVIN